MLRFSIVCVHLLLCVSSVIQASGDTSVNPEYDLRWASSGGAWRSMVADMAFANVFAQAGLITPESSSFSAISTNSGASWFSLQFFYSPVFFNKTVVTSPEELGIFTTEWMQFYRKIFVNDPDDLACRTFGSEQFLIKQFANLCYLFIHLGGDWANATQDMLTEVSRGYGDPGLVERKASPENRVHALQTTNLMVQIDLAPNSRVMPPGGTSKRDIISYLGPASFNGDGTIYTAPLTVQYTVTADSAKFRKAGDDGLSVYSGPAPRRYVLKDYKPFFLYPPPPNATLTIDKSALTHGASLSLAGRMRKPFGGQVPTVNQVGGAGSAALGALSGLVPSLLAQATSILLYPVNKRIDTTDLSGRQFISNTYNQVLRRLYNAKFIHGVAVCSQWPKPCKKLDGRFVDGGYTDGITLAMTIGQYHQAKGDIGNLMKVIVTNTFEPAKNKKNHPILVYFSNPGNQNIEPGAYHWPHRAMPMPSLQIFGDSLDLNALSALLMPIEGTNLSTAIIKATTVNNEVYGVKAGQEVEILLIDLNSALPTLIIGHDAVDGFVGPISQMAVDIAGDEVLLARVKSFASPTYDLSMDMTQEYASSAAPIRSVFVLLAGIGLALAIAVLQYAL